MGKVLLLHGRSEIKLGELGDSTVDSIVTDPPYGISFMGKKWDYDVPGVDIWRECLRVLKPGGHLLCACGTRTQHRMTINIEDAGFEIRDLIAWVYGSGFPKSLNVGKKIDQLQGNEREVVGFKEGTFADIRRDKETGEAELHGGIATGKPRIKVVNSKGTSEFEGWGTALKPAMELWTLARKPISEKSIAENCLKWGTGGLNIDGCRVEFVSEDDKKESTAKNQHENFGTKPMTGNNVYGDYSMIKPKNFNPPGRFPANFIHDGSDEVVGLFPETKGPWGKDSKGETRGEGSMFGIGGVNSQNELRGQESGSAARFFYCAKASKADRDEGLEVEEKFFSSRPWCDEENYSDDRGRIATRLVSKVGKNHHPTVKPTSLMRYLCKLITPKGGTVLDPFMGSGSTGKAAVMEGFGFIGVEMEAEYVEISRARIAFAEGLVEQEGKKVDAQLKLF